MKLTAALCLLASCAAFAATEETTNRTFQIPSGGTLRVEVNFGSINVGTNATADAVTVEVWRKITRKKTADEESFLRRNPVEFQLDGNTLAVRCLPKAEKNGWFFNAGSRNEAKYTIRVPARFNAKLDTAGGDITVNDLSGEVVADTSGGGLRFAQVHGPLKGDTSGGGIHVSDCEGTIKVETSGGGIDVQGGGGSLHGGTSGGGVTVRDFNGPASVETSGGGITVENIRGKLSGETSGGPIKAVIPSPVPGDVKLSTSGGGVTVKIPGDAAFNLVAETSGGGVRCELPITLQGKSEEDSMKGTVNGGGPRLQLESSGGGIRIKKM